MTDITVRPRRSIRTTLWTGVAMAIVGVIVGIVYLSIFAWLAFDALRLRRK